MKKAGTGERLNQLVEAEELEMFLEAIHNQQSSESFTPSAQRLGWYEHKLPKGFSHQVIRRIQRENIVEPCDWRVLVPVFCLFCLLCIVGMVSAGRMMAPLKPSGQFQVALGLFWLVVALGLTAGIFSITVMRYSIGRTTPSHRV